MSNRSARRRGSTPEERGALDDADTRYGVRRSSDGPYAAPPGRSTGSARAKTPQTVRLIGGAWKRSKLPVADRPGLRPTPDRVRETLFNWLRQDLSGWRCLDAFAGSGALGLEAASRGAKHVVLVERDPVLAESLRRTIERLGAAKVEVVCGDGVAVLRRTPTASCDLVFIDPPYGSGMLEPALDAATRVVVPGGFAYAEDSNALQAPAGWGLFRHGRAGAVWFHLFQREGSFG